MLTNPRSPHVRRTGVFFGAAALLLAWAVPREASAEAGPGHLYTSLSLGYGVFTGKKLITKDTGVGDNPDTDPAVCCPSGGLEFEARAGYAFFDIVAPEFSFIGHGWDLGSSAGGAGFIGGGLRLFPLMFLNLADIDMSGFPIGVGIGGVFGYSVAGKDFAYTGSFFGLDLTADYLLSETIGLGIRFNSIFPAYSNFVFTDYGNDLGRCLNSESDQVLGAPFVKGSLPCTGGKGPSTTFLSIQLAATFRFQLFD